MRRVVVAIIVVASLFALAATASATHVPTTGTPIRLLNPAVTPTTFPANTPFFVRHGFACLPEELALCLDSRTEFRLYIDGQRMRSALDLELNLSCQPVVPSDECSARVNLTNVRFGLPAGPHAFRGEWWASGQLEIVREATIEFVG